jgi:hypothetical protein
VAWGGNEMTREKARELLIREYPKDDYMIIYNSGWLNNLPLDHIKELERIGLIRAQKAPTGISVFNIFLTEKGKQYLISYDNKKGKYTIRTATINFGEITGIFALMPNVAKVEYTISVDNLTPFAPFSETRGGLVNETATFMLYDDGWRKVE